jgi:crotonobetainyl-CoA:carnitine CoA-transferase CaiB-like acyl-CoA transferase
MSRSPGDAAHPAPFLGQSNAEVYSELLGYDEATIDRLQSEGII